VTSPTSRLHPSTQAIAHEPDPTTALGLASRLATAPPPDWAPEQWATIAAAANARAATDPRWFKVKVLACENDISDRGPIDALWGRAQLIAALGVDASDTFCSMSVFVERVENVVGADTPEAVLASYQAARSAIFSAPRDSPASMTARDAFLRGRRLRELGIILLVVVEAGNVLPAHLHQWTTLAGVREEDFPLGGRGG
jgi:hypothetical protein